MAGYDYKAGMSNNAVSAYDRGLRPISKIRAADLRRIGFKHPLSFAKWLLKEVCGYQEKHHCSREYNFVPFYNINDLLEIEPDDREKYYNQYKREIAEQQSQGGVRVRGKYPEFIGSRNHRRYVGDVEFEGTLKGNTIYLDGGKQKRANGRHITYVIIDDAK